MKPLETEKMNETTEREATTEQQVPHERFVMWRCNGAINGQWCDYRMTDTEMQAHRFDLGCPRCKQSFADFSLYFEDDGKAT